MEILTKCGAVRGKQEGRFLCFLGIPYAKAERFQPPQPYCWSETLDCTSFGKKAIQPFLNTPPWVPRQTRSEFDEDCLNLNIYTPSLEKNLPVVIYIHGGAFQDGSNQRRTGAQMIRDHDFLYVSVNYRLGALGYLYLGRLLGDAYQQTGNLGTLDQLAAVKWVYENIASFGGDPGRITVMGESAGAKSISALLTRPEMQTYCKQVCLASGADQCIRDEGTADTLARRFLGLTGAADAGELLTMSPAALLAAQEKLCAGLGSTCMFGPVADGVVIPLSWENCTWKGSAIVGSCRNELAYYKWTDPQFLQNAPAIAEALFGRNAEIAKETFAKLVRPEDADDVRADLWVKILTDDMYRTYTERMAKKLCANGGRVWYYTMEFGNAIHCLDQGIAFDGNRMPQMLGDVPLEDVEALANTIYESYVRFFCTGDPNGAALPQWPALEPDNPREMVWDKPVRVKAVPEADTLQDFPGSVYCL